MKKESCHHEEEHQKRAQKAKAEMLTVGDAEKIGNIFRVLAEPSRLKIVWSLLEGELCVYHIVEAVGGNQSAVSHQLRVLKDNRVIRSRREGQNVLYSLADEHIREILALSGEHLSCGGKGV